MKETNEEISAIGNGIIEMIKNLISMMLQPMKELITLLFDNDEAVRIQIAEIMTTMDDKINAVVSNIEVEQSTYMGLKLHDLELKIDETVEQHNTLMLCVEEIKRGIVEKYQTLDGKIFELDELMTEKINKIEEDIEDNENNIEEIVSKLGLIGDILSD